MDEKTNEILINGVNRRASQADSASPDRMLLGQQDANSQEKITSEFLKPTTKVIQKKEANNG